MRRGVMIIESGRRADSKDIALWRDGYAWKSCTCCIVDWRRALRTRGIDASRFLSWPFQIGRTETENKNKPKRRDTGRRHSRKKDEETKMRPKKEKTRGAVTLERWQYFMFLRLLLSLLPIKTTCGSFWWCRRADLRYPFRSQQRQYPATSVGNYARCKYANRLITFFIRILLPRLKIVWIIQFLIQIILQSFIPPFYVSWNEAIFQNLYCTRRRSYFYSFPLRGNETSRMLEILQLLFSTNVSFYSSVCTDLFLEKMY